MRCAGLVGGEGDDEDGAEGERDAEQDRLPADGVGGVEAVMALGDAEEALDGLIASGKFCMSRHGMLRLTWWRRPLDRR